MIDKLPPQLPGQAGPGGQVSGLALAAIPDPVPGELPRPHLLTALGRVGERRCTVLTAPPGYGKTVTAAQWARSVMNTVPVFWATIPPVAAADTDRAFLRAVADLLKALTTGEPGHTPDARRENDDEAAPLTNRALVDAVSVAPPALLVVDGLCGDAPSQALAAAAGSLAAARCCAIHLLVTSRALAPHQIHLSPLSETSLVLTAHDLSFNPDETWALASRVPNAEGLTRVAAAKLCETLDGSPQGIIATARHWPAATVSTPDRAVAAAIAAADAELTSMFSRQFKETLDPPEKLLLQRTACLEDLSGDLCDTATGTTGSAEDLRRLHEAGKFLARSSRGHGWYRLHPFVRSLLDHEAAATDPETRRATLRAAARFLDEDDDPLGAATCYLELHEWVELLEAVHVGLPTLIKTNALPQLGKLLSRVPVRQLLTKPGRLVATAGLLLNSGSVRAALDLLSANESSFDPGEHMLAALTRADASPWLSDVRYCIDHAQQAVDRCDTLGSEHRFDDFYYVKSRTDHWQARARSRALLAGAFQGTWADIAHHFQPLPPGVTTELSAIAQVQVRAERAIYLTWAGQLRAAEGEMTLALKLVEQGQLQTNVIMALVHLARGEALRAQARSQEAIEVLQRCIDHSIATGRVNLIAAASAGIATCELDRHAPEAALAMIDAYRQDWRHTPPPFLTGLLAAAEGRALVQLGNYRRATSLLAAAPATTPVVTARVLCALAENDFEACRLALTCWPDDPTIYAAVVRDITGAAAFEVTGGGKHGAPLFAKALDLAAEHKLAAPFVHAAPFVMRLLRRSANGEGSPARHAAAVLAVAGEGDTRGPLLSKLTSKETLVYSHLGRAITLPRLASELQLSTNTVRSHVKSIYRKLGVSSREEAVALTRHGHGPTPARSSSTGPSEP